MFKNNKFIKKNIKKDKLLFINSSEIDKKYFQSVSSSYSDFINHYFCFNDRGEINGFRFVKWFN